MSILFYIESQTTRHRVPSFLSQNIPGYLHVLSRSKKPFSRLYYKKKLHQNADAKGVLKSQEQKTRKTLSQYNSENIEMLYILTFQVLSRFSAKNFLFCSGFTFWANSRLFLGLDRQYSNLQVVGFRWKPCRHRKKIYFRVGLCIVYWYISAVDTLDRWYVSYQSLSVSYVSCF